jgi:uncharacterized protein (DUF934 family)
MSEWKRLIRNARLEADAWRVFDAPSDDVVPPDETGWIVTLPLWLAARERLRRRTHAVAVQLSPDSDPRDLLEQGQGAIEPDGIAFIAIMFPAYTDGRGYSLAQILRTQCGWNGELRAVGDVMIDTVHYLARCGFDTFLVKPGHDPQAALRALRVFSVHYQQVYRRVGVGAADC